MTYSIHEKALAIHRVIKCGMSIQSGFRTKEGMEANSDLRREWCTGDNLMLAIKNAFIIWEQRWRVQRERDILDASALDLDTTAVDSKPPRDFYMVPALKEREYSEAYDIIQEYRCQANHHTVGYVGRSGHTIIGDDSRVADLTITGEGNDLIQRARSFRDQMVARQDAHRKSLADRLGIN